MLSVFVILSMYFGGSFDWSFEDFPVYDCEPFERVAKLSRDSLPDNSYIMEAFDAQWKRGENNFACHYYVLSYGCGRQCQMNLIFDQRTGKCIRSLITSSGVAYRENSRILVAFIGASRADKKEYYIIENDQLRRFEAFDRSRR